MKLTVLVPFFTQKDVRDFIDVNNTKLLRVRDLIQLAHTKVDELSVEQVTAIAFASVLFGGSAWASLPRMFYRLDEFKRDEVLSRIKPLLATKFTTPLAEWFYTSWKYLEEQTLLLLKYLSEQEQQYISGDLSALIATISTMVQIKDVTEFFILSEGFSRFSTSEIVLSAIAVQAPKWSSDQKLSFGQFDELVDFLTESDMRYIVKSNESKLTGLPLNKWMERLTELQVASTVCDAESIQYRLNQLCNEYGKLTGNHALDLCSTDARFKRATHQAAATKPNALQFANAQYAALSLKMFPKQLWCIPSG